jgi:hypothetical protein
MAEAAAVLQAQINAAVVAALAAQAAAVVPAQVAHVAVNPLPSGRRTDWPYTHLIDKCSKKA